MEYRRNMVRKNLTIGEQNLRNKILFEIWERYKSSHSMRELARILGIPLTTFFRSVKSYAQQKVEQKEEK